MGMKAFKTASCDINNFILLEAIAKTKKPVLLSTGASTVKEIKQAIDFLKKNKSGEIIILHCTLCYPTNIQDFNIGGIPALQHAFKNHLIGLSDHSLGIDMTIASALAGAKIIEKHFTIDKSLKKSADHWLSIDPNELEKLVKATALNYKSMNLREKKVLLSEKIARKNARRSLVSSNIIPKNTVLKAEMITAKRPGIGIEPSKIKKIIGLTTKKNIPKDTILNLKMFK